MIAKISRFKIYKQTLNSYKDNKNYQLSNGKPDIRKIKKEAVDKLIAEVIINHNADIEQYPELREEINQSLVRQWWNSILDWIKGIYRKTNIDIFKKAANKVLNKNIGTVGDIENKENQIYLQNDISKTFRKTGLNLEETTIPKDFEVLFGTSVNKDSREFSIFRDESLGSLMRSTIYQKANGRSFKDISEKRINLEGGEIQQYSIIRAIQSLFSNEFNRKLASKLELGAITIVNNPTGNSMYTVNGKLYININEKVGIFPHIIHNSTEEFENDLLDTSISEELIHIVSSRLSNSLETSRAYKELTNEDKLNILRIYKHDKNASNIGEMTQHQYVHEYVRMQIQKKTLGYTTEEKRNVLENIINRVWEFIKDLIPLYTSLNSIYDKTLNFIRKGEGNLDNTTPNELLGLSELSDKQKDIQKKIEDTKNKIEKVVEEGKTDPLLLDSEEANNFYRIKKDDGTWEKITKRVTDRVKSWYKQRFGSKVFTAQEQEFNELKKKYGVEGHADFEEIHSRYYNEDGTKREIPLESPQKFNLPSQDMYDKLEKYYVDLVSTFPKDTLIFSEVVIYDEKQKKQEQ